MRMSRPCRRGSPRALRPWPGVGGRSRSSAGPDRTRSRAGQDACRLASGEPSSYARVRPCAHPEAQNGSGASGAIGTIIFVGSVHQVIPWAFQANHAVSKGGVWLLMQSLAQELARMNQVRSERRAIGRPGRARGRCRAPETHPLWPHRRAGGCRSAVVWLASAASDYVTGTTLFIGGGMTLSCLPWRRLTGKGKSDHVEAHRGLRHHRQHDLRSPR
jgi:NAD(P)-dependent dehydrogenase (short-subunit alcohol dehydrogenase family)